MGRLSREGSTKNSGVDQAAWGQPSRAASIEQGWVRLSRGGVNQAGVRSTKQGWDQPSMGGVDRAGWGQLSSVEVTEQDRVD